MVLRSFVRVISGKSKRGRRLEELKPHREQAQAAVSHPPIIPLLAQLEQHLDKACVLPIEEDMNCKYIQTICENSMNESSYIQNLRNELFPRVHDDSSSRIVCWAFDKHLPNLGQYSLIPSSEPDIVLGFRWAYLKENFPDALARLRTRISLSPRRNDVAFPCFVVEAKYSERRLDIAGEQNEKNRIVMLSSMGKIFVAAGKPELLGKLVAVTLTLAEAKAEAFLNYAYLDDSGNMIFPEPWSIRKWDLYKDFARAKKQINALIEFIQAYTWQNIREALSQIP